MAVGGGQFRVGEFEKLFNILSADCKMQTGNCQLEPLSLKETKTFIYKAMPITVILDVQLACVKCALKI